MTSLTRSVRSTKSVLPKSCGEPDFRAEVLHRPFHRRFCGVGLGQSELLWRHRLAATRFRLHRIGHWSGLVQNSPGWRGLPSDSPETSVVVGQQHGRISNSLLHAPLSTLHSPLSSVTLPPICTDAHASFWRREFQVKFLGHAAFSCFHARYGNRPSAALLSPSNEEYGNAPQANCPTSSNRCDARTLGKSRSGLIPFLFSYKQSPFPRLT